MHGFEYKTVGRETRNNSVTSPDNNQGNTHIKENRTFKLHVRLECAQQLKNILEKVDLYRYDKELLYCNGIRVFKIK